ncbi:antirestriction protein ArdC [Bradyrhizobium sp. LB8.2]|uniref:ArdC family protein n=1 Tax=unclassified Bradyrhizobium TaxID=2631580 RepID=UPI00339B7486
MRTADLYSKVTDSIIKQLEAGVIPWTKPWAIEKKAGIAYVPTNVATGRPYSGINTLLLWAEAMERGFHSHSWMTFKQANDIGAHVRKGEHGSTVVFTKWTEKPDETSGEMKKKSLLKTYTVFHVEQLEKLPPAYQATVEPPPETEVYEGALRLIRDCGLDLQYSGTKAAYYPQRDQVVLPPYSWFESPDEFYGVAFHEVIHATGHKDRLNRNLSTRFGSNAYAFEELVAELGSAFLCAHSGIPARHRSASYVENWLTVLKDDKRAIFQAASYASQAADWVRHQAEPEVQPETQRQISEKEMGDSIAF